MFLKTESDEVGGRALLAFLRGNHLQSSGTLLEGVDGNEICCSARSKAHAESVWAEVGVATTSTMKRAS